MYMKAEEAKNNEGLTKGLKKPKAKKSKLTPGTERCPFCNFLMNSDLLESHCNKKHAEKMKQMEEMKRKSQPAPPNIGKAEDWIEDPNAPVRDGFDQTIEEIEKKKKEIAEEVAPEMHVADPERGYEEAYDNKITII
ncbi:MAG: hypothetical protein MJ252_12550 [archaeon]|nr:hypothetical protein [archaeon]